MTDIAGKVAFITGGASGIGLGMAKAFGNEGARIVIADINETQLKAAVAELAEENIEAVAVILDVGDAQAWPRVIDDVESRVGPIQIVCNNAGVNGATVPVEDIPYNTWRWVFSVNLDSHLHSMHTLLPRFKARGSDCHIVQTISMAGLISARNAAVYCSSKFASLGLAHVLRAELAGSKIGISVLCPGLVRTRLAETSDLLRPQGIERDPDSEGFANMLAQGIHPDSVGKQVVAAVKNDEYFIITHPEWKPMVVDLFGKVLASFGEPAETGHVAPLGPSTLFQ